VNSGTLTLSLEKNGTEVTSISSDTLNYTFTPVAGENDVNFDLIADNGEGLADTASVFVTIREGDGVNINRPAGLQDGITEKTSSVTLSLFAPQKEYVYVIGDFNDWQPSSEYLMNKETTGTDSTWFWLEIEGLTPGEEYGFQYLVEGDLRIADPYSYLVLDPYNDGYIPEANFPNLKPYPAGKTSGWVSIMQPGSSEYIWEATDYQRPEKTELIVYELLIRDFLEEKNYQTLTDTLDYLENLGVNAIELMPVNEFDGNLSWGYNPSFHLALDKFYGTPEAFKKFVDEAHKRDIAVILDVVMNHATGINPLYQLYDSNNNPYFNASARHSYNVFNDFNHQYSGTQYYTRRMIEHWIEEYNVDGFRWDLTKGFTQNCTAGNEACTGGYQQDRVDILKKYADFQWAADPDFYVIFEHLGSEKEEAEWANYRISEGKGVMLWGNMNGNYSEASMGYHEGGKSNLYGVLSESRSSFQERHVVGYMESHDEQWMMHKNLNFGNSSGDYNIQELNTALNRQKLAGAFFFTLPGPKMIWQFGELGYGGGEGECLKPGDGTNGDCLSTDPNRVGEKPIRWDYYNSEERLKLYKTWSEIIRLRNSSPVFTDPENAIYNLEGTTKTITLEHEDSDVLIVGNFGILENTVQIVYPSTGTWHDYFFGTSQTISDPNIEITLEPGEFRIFTTREFETPEEELIPQKDGKWDTGIPESFTLMQNYPNPFNPYTTITYDVAKDSNVKLEVYDLLGRKVQELVNERQEVNSYTVQFDAKNLSSGVYIYRLKAGGKVFTKKMTLIK
ncbi:MAG TPA: alpha-amylase family glycosyl hydrolase, partial [Gracilimonas sp.]|uniref:alpha-amylase family glycosyl hydrolase n=1 Tax=Gracilimonas sp. TaxID=1974203 RepID=UPI002DA6500C|nr:alpha-amylase family glycosyl hydrolase [Gracilimonas sp.]